MVQEAINRFGAEGGSVINISSIVGSHPVAGALLYASTKGAIEALTKGLALELAPRKIRVNAIAPGHTETEGNITGLVISELIKKDVPSSARESESFRSTTLKAKCRSKCAYSRW